MDTCKPQKKYFRIIFIQFLVLLTFPALSLADRFKVTRIYDGDTIRAEGHGTALRVRMVGIDAPELGTKAELRQPFGEEARDYLADLILNKHVEIIGHGYGDHNLLLGSVFLDGLNVNLEMTRAGMAEVSRDEPTIRLSYDSFIKAENEAKAARKGIWAQGKEYISPGEWRQLVRARSACALLLYGIYTQQAR
jgi:micrococcal nuclease